VKPEILVAPKEQLVETFASRFERQAAAAIAERGRFAVALPGGSVATAFFPRLAGAAVDWSRTHFFWSDERAVPITDAASNFALAERLWLRPAAVPVGNVHRPAADVAELSGLEAAAANAERELTEILGSPPRLDLLWLGIGEDGHVASLFPGHALLDESRRYVAPLLDSPKPPAVRLTLTLPAIAAARRVIFSAMGEAKAEAIGIALRDPHCRLPLALALAAARRAWLLLDLAAAKRVPAAPRSPSAEAAGR
jgi:6-phosphogluconolactonase